MNAKPAVVRKRLLVIGISALLLLALAIFFFMPHLSHWLSLLNPAPQDPDKEAGPRSLALAERKNIYDRNYKGLAVSFTLSSIYARPLEIEQPEQAAAQLAGLLRLDEKEVLTALKSERSFVWLGRQVAPNVAGKIADLNLKGVYHIDEVQRFYPNYQSAAQVVGFMKDDQGLAGIEAYYDNVLRGGGLHDPALATASIPLRLAAGKNGAHIILSLDLRIQEQLERELKLLMKKTKAGSGIAAVMGPDSGEILGLAILPSYDPNRFWDYSAEQRKNRFITDPIFPGALNGLVRFAAAVEVLHAHQDQPLPAGGLGEDIRQPKEAGAAATDTSDRVWRQTRDGVYAPAWLQFPAKPVADRDSLGDFVDLLGFSRPSGIDLPVEGGERIAAEVQESKTFDPADPASATTALRLLTAFSRLVDNGRSITPHFIKEVWDMKEERGLTAWYGSDAPAVGSQTSQDLIAFLSDLAGGSRKKGIVLESLVDMRLTGAGKAAGVPPPDDEAAGEEEARFHAVLLGAAPAKEPKVTLIIVLDDGRIDLAGNSPLKQTGQRLLGKVQRLAKEKPGRPAKPFLAVSEEESYGKWLKLQHDAASVPSFSPAAQRERMPDLRGYSLRKALQELQEYGLRIKVVGSGKVVRQHPGPGSSLKSVDECVIELQKDK